MSLHVFANIVTPFGTAANNRGDGQGSNITPLQKLIWLGQPHTTVSAEAIRFAFRRQLRASGEPCNRQWAEHLSELPQDVFEQFNKASKGKFHAPCGYFKDPDFVWYKDPANSGFADDDLLGFMSAEAAKEEAEATDLPVQDDIDQESTEAVPKGKKKAKGTAFVRRAVLEVARAVSLTPWAGDVTFNAASPGATPSAQKKGSNPVPYGTELHATRYQFGLALTPERLRDKSRAAKALAVIGALGTVAGNQGRFLFDFSPDSIVIRLTDDPAPRLLYCFETTDDGKTVIAPSLFRRIEGGDIDSKELILGGTFAADAAVSELKAKGAAVFPNGVKAAVAEAVGRINAHLKTKG
jgi:CRISPR-associated protein Cst2